MTPFYHDEVINVIPYQKGKVHHNVVIHIQLFDFV